MTCAVWVGNGERVRDASALATRLGAVTDALLHHCPATLYSYWRHTLTDMIQAHTQLSLLSSAGQEMGTGQSALMTCICW